MQLAANTTVNNIVVGNGTFDQNGFDLVANGLDVQSVAGSGTFISDGALTLSNQFRFGPAGKFTANAGSEVILELPISDFIISAQGQMFDVIELRLNATSAQYVLPSNLFDANELRIVNNIPSGSSIHRTTTNNRDIHAGIVKILQSTPGGTLTIGNGTNQLGLRSVDVFNKIVRRVRRWGQFDSRATVRWNFNREALRESSSSTVQLLSALIPSCLQCHPAWSSRRVPSRWLGLAHRFTSTPSQ